MPEIKEIGSPLATKKNDQFLEMNSEEEQKLITQIIKNEISTDTLMTCPPFFYNLIEKEVQKRTALQSEDQSEQEKKEARCLEQTLSLLKSHHTQEPIVFINEKPIKTNEITATLAEKGYNPLFIFKTVSKVETKTIPWSEVETSDPLLLYKKLFSITKNMIFNKGENLIQNASCFLAVEKTLSFLDEEDPIKNSPDPKTPHPKIPPGKLNNFFTRLEKEGHCAEDINKIKSILQNKKFLSEEEREEREEREESPMILYKTLFAKLTSIDQTTRTQEAKMTTRCIEQTLDTLWAKAFKR